MPLNKSKGNMYPWVTHTHSHLRGQCPHGCSYCYVQAHERRWHSGAFAGPLRLDEKELTRRYGSGKTIFIEHQNDLFAEDTPSDFISKVLLHCADWPDNTYVFQTKNPGKLRKIRPLLPPKYMVGVTIESNRHFPDVMGKTPPPVDRCMECQQMSTDFVTIEPILDCDPRELAIWIGLIRPRFVNIGADSKGHNLPEPSADKLRELIDRLGKLGIEIREKHNLDRLLNA